MACAVSRLFLQLNVAAAILWWTPSHSPQCKYQGFIAITLMILFQFYGPFDPMHSPVHNAMVPPRSRSCQSRHWQLQPVPSRCIACRNQCHLHGLAHRHARRGHDGCTTCQQSRHAALACGSCASAGRRATHTSGLVLRQCKVTLPWWQIISWHTVCPSSVATRAAGHGTTNGSAGTASMQGLRCMLCGSHKIALRTASRHARGEQ